jgi:hypothetical protein
VDDPNGTVTRLATRADGTTYERHLREDPVEATRQTLAQIISIVGTTSDTMIPGKVGHTTDTYYPQSGEGGANTTTDGLQDTDTTSVSWATAIASGGGRSFDTVVTDPFIFWRDGTSANTFRYVRRSGFTFDTSAIADADNIDSATFTLVGTDKADPVSNTPNINVYTFAPANAADFVAGDFDSYGSTALSTTISYASWNTAGSNNFALNSTGLAEVSKTGVTKLGASAPTYGGSGSDTSLVGDWADEGAGTTNDPKLVVVHTAANSAPIAPPLFSPRAHRIQRI